MNSKADLQAIRRIEKGPEKLPLVCGRLPVRVLYSFFDRQAVDQAIDQCRSEVGIMKRRSA